jgi:hypothetical protein
MTLHPQTNLSSLPFSLTKVLKDNNQHLQSSDVTEPTKFNGLHTQWDDFYLQLRTYLEAKGWLDTFDHKTGPGTPGFNTEINKKIYNKLLALCRVEIALHPTAQTVPVAPTFQQLTASAPSAPATHANLAAPEYHYSTTSRQQSRYDFGRNDVPSQDDFYGSGDAYGNPRNYYGNRNARFAMSKRKGKRSFNAKGTRGAIPKDWDADQVIIPDFGTTPGISFYYRQ